MKTYLGWLLARGPDGSWTFTPPDDYRDPDQADPAGGDIVYVVLDRYQVEHQRAS
ncbi:MAG: hypothetical protein ACRDYF_19510 [Acidimicrobiia bacterium]